MIFALVLRFLYQRDFIRLRSTYRKQKEFQINRLTRDRQYEAGLAGRRPGIRKIRFLIRCLTMVCPEALVFKYRFAASTGAKHTVFVTRLLGSVFFEMGFWGFLEDLLGTCWVIFGGFLLLNFSFKYIKRSLNRHQELISIHDQSYNSAFWQALLVMMTNPKVLTTWLAVISLFPIITLGLQNILGFILLSAAASFSGHAIFATFFSSKTAAAMYLLLYRPLNGLVGIGFFFYGIKLLSGAFV